MSQRQDTNLLDPNGNDMDCMLETLTLPTKRLTALGALRMALIFINSLKLSLKVFWAFLSIGPELGGLGDGAHGLGN